MSCWHGFLASLVLAAGPADPTQCVADALEAEATWRAFPGFVADLEVEWNGRAILGRAVIAPDGRVFVEHLPESHRARAVLQLDGIVRQRLPREANTTWAGVSSDPGSGCAGRAVCRMDAPFGPHWWIQNQQVQAVEARCAGHRQRITILKTDRNPDNKKLPVVLVAHGWSARSLKLEATQTTHLSWRRVGTFDLPATVQVLSAGNIAPVLAGQGLGLPAPANARMTLSRHRLLTGPEVLLTSR